MNTSLIHRIFVLIGFSITLCTFNSYSQVENKDLRSGNRYYRQKDYDSAEKQYRTAVTKNGNSFYGNYNLGNALYRKNDWQTARNYFQKAVKLADTKKERADAYHNLGCTYLQEQKYKESVDALRKSLMENPEAEDTRNQLAYAQRMLKKQQDQQPPKPNAGDKIKKDEKMSQENAQQILKSLDDDMQKKPSGKQQPLLKNW